VRGLPPSQGDLQYIDRDRVYAAQKRPPVTLKDDPIIAGVDVARGGGGRRLARSLRPSAFSEPLPFDRALRR
jgi:hypothetical protein